MVLILCWQRICTQSLTEETTISVNGFDSLLRAHLQMISSQCTQPLTEETIVSCQQLKLSLLKTRCTQPLTENKHHLHQQLMLKVKAQYHTQPLTESNCHLCQQLTLTARCHAQTLTENNYHLCQQLTLTAWCHSQSPTEEFTDTTPSRQLCHRYCLWLSSLAPCRSVNSHLHGLIDYTGSLLPPLPCSPQ